MARSARHPAEVHGTGAPVQARPSGRRTGIVAMGGFSPAEGDDDAAPPSGGMGTFLPVQESAEFRVPPVCGIPPVTRRTIDAAVETWSAAVSGVADYWSAAIVERRMPADMALDGLRWWQLMADRRPPQWASRHRVARRTRLTRLRDFTPPHPADVVPTLVLPPQAGHDSCVVDYSPRQSQMQTILAAGLERLYALDWIGVTQETKDATITDYLAEVHAAVHEAGDGGRVNLIGDCQGGWLAAIYAALHPERVNTLTIAGAPIDFHAGSAVIHDSVQTLSDDDLSFFRALVAHGDGVLKGEFLLGGFIVIRPENEVGRQLQLLAHVRDAHHVERYRAFEDWFKHTQDIAGPFYLWLVQHLFRDNELIRGALRIGDAAVELGRIECPVNLLAGATDHITPPEQVFALAGVVSTPAERITTRTTSGGHLGLFMGTEALRDHWPVVMASVLEHSHPRANGAKARRNARSRTARERAIPAP
jgi:poly(3-hydroxybutyrate) depolymerase